MKNISTIIGDFTYQSINELREVFYENSATI